MRRVLFGFVCCKDGNFQLCICFLLNICRLSRLGCCVCRSCSCFESLFRSIEGLLLGCICLKSLIGGLKSKIRICWDFYNSCNFLFFRLFLCTFHNHRCMSHNSANIFLLNKQHNKSLLLCSQKVQNSIKCYKLSFII